MDSDTLDTVVGALDALNGGERMVGIVTPVRELAERLPARLEVGTVGRTSTVRLADTNSILNATQVLTWRLSVLSKLNA